MRHLYFLPLLMLPAAAFALPASPADIAGEYEWHYTDATNGTSKIVMVDIQPTLDDSRVLVSGLYLDVIVPAAVDFEAGTIALENVDLPSIMEGACLTHMLFEADGSKSASDSPLTGSFQGDDIIFPEGEGIGVGIPAFNAYFTLARDCSFLRNKNKDFVFDPEEWVPAGSAELTDAWLSYHYLGELDGPSYDVEVMRHKEAPGRLCLIDPFPNEIWGEYNADPEAHGHIVIDISNPDVVKLQPRVYSGFTDATYGPLMMYNYEGNFAWFENMDDDAITDRLARLGGLPTSHLEDELLVITGPIFATAAMPTAIYGWQEEPAYVILPEEALNPTSGCVEIPAAPSAPMYFNLQGAPVQAPAHGIFIMLRDGRARKVII